MTPTYPVSPAQVQSFRMAVCERLGIDHALVSKVEAEVMGDNATVTVTAHLPGDEVRDLWNAAAVAAEDT